MLNKHYITNLATFRDSCLYNFLVYYKIKQKCINAIKKTSVTQGFFYKFQHQ